MSALARAPRPMPVRLGHSAEPPLHAYGVAGIFPGVRRSRVRSHRPPPDVRYIFQQQEQQPVVAHKFQAEAAVNAWCDLCVHFIFSEALRCSDCKYTCHSHCKDRVHLSCEPNGKLMECIPANETLDRSNNNEKDIEKEKDSLSYLSKEETKDKIQLYNAAVTDKLKMTLNSSGIYTGFIKVQMELRRPITVRGHAHSHAHSNGNETAFYLPKGSLNILHISSTNTVREVIEALLKKFLIADNPAKFALYKRCQKEDQVYMCRLSDREHPLYLRLVAGPCLEALGFVLREHETGDVMWEAFSLPELQNFLRILDKEENEQLQSLKRRYTSYRAKLEEALSGVHNPG